MLLVAQAIGGLEQALTAAVATVPALVVLVILVILFLRFLSEQQKQRNTSQEQNQQFMSSQVTAMQDISDDCKTTIRDNTQVMREMIQHLGKMGK